MSGGCPHPYGLKADGRCYHCLKLAACNGHRSKLSVEALGFVGFVSEVELDRADTARTAWSPAAVSPYHDALGEELARIRDIAPGWYELARRIVDE